MDIETLALARSYVRQSLNGVGALKGNPCRIKKIEEFEEYNLVTFAWTDNTGVERTSVMKVKNGTTGEGGGTFTGKATVDCGGIKAGNTFDANSVQEMFEALLSPKIPPKITFALNPSTTLYKKGTSISSIQLKATVTKGTDPLSKVEFYRDGALINTISSDISSGSTQTYTYNATMNSNITFKAKVTDSGGLSAEGSKTIKFIYPFYMGIVNSTTVNEGVITALTMVLNDTMPYTWSGITMTNKRACIAYPSEYGSLTSVKDGNEFEVLSSFQKTNVTIGGVVYFCYCMKETGTLNNGKLILTV